MPRATSHPCSSTSGFSEDGAARNAALLGADIGSVKAMVLSHGHSDHTGGFSMFSSLLKGEKDKVEFVCHPGVFMKPRYLKFGEEIKVYFPEFTRDAVLKEGIKLMETTEPYPLLDGQCPVPRRDPPAYRIREGFPHRPPGRRQARKSGTPSKMTRVSR